MGDAADELENWEIDQMFKRVERAQERQCLIHSVGELDWTTAQGRKVKFKDIHISHLENVVKVLDKRGFKKIGMLNVYLAHRKEEDEAEVLE